MEATIQQRWSDERAVLDRTVFVLQSIRFCKFDLLNARIVRAAETFSTSCDELLSEVPRTTQAKR